MVVFPVAPLPGLTVHLQRITWSRVHVIKTTLVRYIPYRDTVEDSSLLTFFFKILFIYLIMRDTEKEAET